MLNGLMGALLDIKKSSYAIGEYPTYLITSAQPGAEISWTSYLNGVEQERDMFYNQYVSADGTLEIRWADPWYKGQTGTWKRVITLYNPDGSTDTASVTFTVGTPGVTAPTPAPTPTPTPTRPTSPPALYPVPGRTPVVTVPPVVRTPSPDILNPAPVPTRPTLTPVPDQTPVPIPAPTNGQVPPRSLYPIGQEPRPPSVGTRDEGPPRSTLDFPPLGTGTIPPGPIGVPRGGDILNPLPVTPVYTAPPGQQPGGQAPSSGGGLGGSVNIGGMDIPIWALLLGAFVLFKGR